MKIEFYKGPINIHLMQWEEIEYCVEKLKNIYILQGTDLTKNIIEFKSEKREILRVNFDKRPDLFYRLYKAITDEYINDEIKNLSFYRTIKLILCSRNDKNSFFSKDHFPMDVFKIIINFIKISY